MKPSRWSGREARQGLQSRVHGFKSRLHLEQHHERAIGAAVARFPDTEEVTGSIPVSPTNTKWPLTSGNASQGPSSCRMDLFATVQGWIFTLTRHRPCTRNRSPCYCTHDNSSQGSYPAACTFPRIGGRGRRRRRGMARTKTPRGERTGRARPLGRSPMGRWPASALPNPHEPAERLGCAKRSRPIRDGCSVRTLELGFGPWRVRSRDPNETGPPGRATSPGSARAAAEFLRRSSDASPTRRRNVPPCHVPRGLRGSATPQWTPKHLPPPNGRASPSTSRLGAGATETTRRRRAWRRGPTRPQLGQRRAGAGGPDN